MSEGKPLDAAQAPVPLPLARPLAAESELSRLPGPPPRLSDPAARSRVCACRPGTEKGPREGKHGAVPISPTSSASA